MLKVAGIAALCGVGCTGVAQAQAWEELHFSEPIETGDVAVSDGRRWAGYELLDGSARLIDTASGRVLTVQPPRRCRRTSWLSGLRAIGGGQAVWYCRIPRNNDAFSSRLFDIEDRRWHAPAAREFVYCAVGPPEPLAIGRWWLAERCPQRYGYGVIYTNWRTGKYRHDRNGAPFPRSPTSLADLNARDGVTELCDPLQRTERPPPADSNGPYLPKYFDYFYDGRRGLSMDSEQGFAVQACGGDTLVTHSGRFDSVQLGAGLVSWLDLDGYVRAFRFGDQRGFESNRTSSVVHTRHAVYVSDSEQVNGQWRKFTAVAAVPPLLP